MNIPLTEKEEELYRSLPFSICRPHEIIPLARIRAQEKKSSGHDPDLSGSPNPFIRGYKTTWIGHKLHPDCIDGDIPVSAILSSVALHDSQAAIPLAQMSSERVTNHYDLMDAVYDSPEIHAFSESLGHRPIIDSNPRRGEKVLMDPATKSRFAERSSVERVNSNLKDDYSGRNIRVKGASKVMAHLMFGIVSITAMQLYRLSL